MNVAIKQFFDNFLAVGFGSRRVVHVKRLLGTINVILVLLPFNGTLLPINLIITKLNYTPVCPDVVRRAPSGFNGGLDVSVANLRVTTTCANDALLSPFFNILTRGVAVGLCPFILLLVLMLVAIFSRRLREGATTGQTKGT